jgi:hypothetical protein
VDFREEGAVIPIYEQGSGHGIGHQVETFIARFDEICRARDEKAFAFIFYDFLDGPLREILRDQGVFAQIDRLAGSTLAVFYLHSGTRHVVARFNKLFMKALGLKGVSVPCVAFFRLDGQGKERGFRDVSAVPLENADLIHGFAELYRVIEAYKTKRRFSVDGLKYTRWVVGAVKFISIETFRALLKNALGHIMG